MGTPSACCRLLQDRARLSLPSGQQPLAPALVGLQSPREICTFIHRGKTEAVSVFLCHFPSLMSTAPFCLQGLQAMAQRPPAPAQSSDGWVDGGVGGLRAGAQQPRAALSPEKGEPRDQPCSLPPELQMPQPQMSVQVPGLRAPCQPGSPCRVPPKEHSTRGFC